MDRWCEPKFFFQHGSFFFKCNIIMKGCVGKSWYVNANTFLMHATSYVTFHIFQCRLESSVHDYIYEFHKYLMEKLFLIYSFIICIVVYRLGLQSMWFTFLSFHYLSHSQLSHFSRFWTLKPRFDNMCFLVFYLITPLCVNICEKLGIKQLTF